MRFKRLRQVLLGAAALSIAAAALSTCESDPYHPRCTALDRYVSTCQSTCAEVTCTADQTSPEQIALGTLSATELAEFDACITCLDDEADTGRCYDCLLDATGQSCQALFGSWFALDCLQP